MDTAQVVELTSRHLMPTYGRVPVAFVRGRGCRLWDAEGRQYLDFLAGIAVCGVGHAHPHVAAAIAAQAQTLLHTSNLYHIGPQAQLAEQLCELSFADRAFFCNSGAEANEAAIKLARKWSLQMHGPGRVEIITAHRSFHGRTMMTLAATAQEKYQKSFMPMPSGFTYVPYDDLEALEVAITTETCAVMLEPLQAEGGLNIPSEGYLRGVRQICTKHGLLLILDEVQTGLGRTGRWWGYEHAGTTPDIMTLAKSLGGGVPIGCCLCTEEASAFEPGDHASTFGGNFLACVAALATLEVMVEQDLVRNAAERGTQLLSGLNGLVQGHDVAESARGVGLLCGLEVAGERAKEVETACRERGLIVNALGTRTVRLAPPLIVTAAEVAEALGLLGEALATL